MSNAGASLAIELALRSADARASSPASGRPRPGARVILMLMAANGAASAYAEDVAVRPLESRYVASDAPYVASDPSAVAYGPAEGASDSTGAASEAELAVRRAELLFEARNYEGALPEFQEAYALLDRDDARRAGLLNNIAVCHERLFHYERAIAYYERYLREGRPSARDRRDVSAAIAKLRGFVSSLQVRSNVEAAVWVDDRELGSSPGAFQLSAGRHVIELRADKHQSVRREVLAVAGKPLSLSLDLRSLPQYEGLSPVYFWLGTGLTVAALSTAAVLGVTAKNADSDARERAARSPWFVTESDKREIHAYQLATNLAFGTAAAFGLSTLVIATLTNFGAPEETPNPKVLAWSLGSGLAPLGVAAEGRFP